MLVASMLLFSQSAVLKQKRKNITMKQYYHYYGREKRMKKGMKKVKEKKFVYACWNVVEWRAENLLGCVY